MRRFALLAFLLVGCTGFDPPVCGGPEGCEPPIDTTLEPYLGTWQLALVSDGAIDPCPDFHETAAILLHADPADGDTLRLSTDDQRSVDMHVTHLDGQVAHVSFTLHDDWGALDGVTVAPPVEYELTVEPHGAISGSATTSLTWDRENEGTTCSYHYVVSGVIQ